MTDVLSNKIIFNNVLSVFTCLLIAGCSFSPKFDKYASCIDGTCAQGCSCIADMICVATDSDRLPWDCGPTGHTCEGGTQCPAGCSCMGEFCMGPADIDCPDGIAPTCMEPDIVVTTQQDEQNGGNNNTDAVIAAGGTGTSLREALILATNTPGPHHITFDLDQGENIYLKNNLPLVPMFTFIDGATPKTRMRPTSESTAANGFVVAQRNVIIGNMHIAGFAGDAIKIIEGASDVNLFHVSLGEEAYPNLNGLFIGPGSSNVTLGRGRRLPCIKHTIVSHGAPNSEYDVNLLLSNTHDGISAKQTTNLRIYGTWIGFTNDQSLCEPGKCGNGWVGIRLEDVEGAIIGVQETESEWEAFDENQSMSMGPAFVAVGGNKKGGVLLHGGGNISMPGLLLGDTPNMSPFAQNETSGIKITGNSGPVSYGGRIGATGRDATAFGLIYTQDATAITVSSNDGPVEITRTQIVTLPDRPRPDFAIYVKNNRASLYLKHLSFTMDPQKAAIQLDGAPIDTKVINCLFRAYSNNLDVPVFSGNSLTFSDITIQNNMQYGFLEWSSEDYPDSSENYSSEIDPLGADLAQNAMPTSLDSPLIDKGEDLGVDMNGITEGLFNGCGPEIGAFECTSPECLNASCN